MLEKRMSLKLFVNDEKVEVIGPGRYTITNKEVEGVELIDSPELDKLR